MNGANEPYIGMYDVRGIQDYIFKTNYAKEIVGASHLVDSIILDGLREYVAALNPDEQPGYMLDWKNDDASAFLNNQEIRMQVVFIGGGYSYVVFRKIELCQGGSR